ncbi:hypothetical protein NEFER03_1171 [Nematocida sp. LUAm3]|nr:hypothetical protein NEFER03_1171 [Nematocida sp. LUAm3]KAI5175780.1 hypothetical protein NEFER02_1649 [Nematocida sp. LUAm2]KAI5178276.1 hypothetical protein NEFER01_1443 [Nematocida sp. LUAm1]
MEHLRDCFLKESKVLGGYTRSEYIKALSEHIKERMQRKHLPKRTLHPDRHAEEEKKQKSKLSAYENTCSTTSLNRCSVLVLAPNTGIIYELLQMILKEKVSEGIDSDPYSFCGEEEDNFLIGLQYSMHQFKESSNFSSDIIVATTKYLVELGDNRIDSSKCFFENEEELENFERKEKMKLGIYSFLSGVQTIFLLDAHVLQLQNIKNLRETLEIVKESVPSLRFGMDLRYVSSGEEKRNIFCLTDIPTPELLSLAKEIDGASTVDIGKYLYKRTKNRITLVREKRASLLEATYHYITTANSSEEKTLVILRDALEVNRIKELLESSSILGISGVFFCDEHTPRNTIKEELEKGRRRIWISTERFIFHRRKRIDKLLHPFLPNKIFSPHILHPEIIRYSSSKRIPLTFLYTEEEQYILSFILAKDFASTQTKDDLEYLDVVEIE